MKTKSRELFWLYCVAVVLNVVFISLIIISVVMSMQNFVKDSYSLNLENVKALTTASAGKVEVALENTSPIVANTANYINNYNETGMNWDKIKSHLYSYYGNSENCWEIIDSEYTGEDVYHYEYAGVCLNKEIDIPVGDEIVLPEVSYNVSQYPMLAKILNNANVNNLGKIVYSSEFTDSYTLNKVFSVATYIRVLEGVNTYSYKTLMLVVASDTINQIISNDQATSTMLFDGYSNVVIDFKGNYVISNNYFLSTSFLNYLSLFNTSFDRAEKTALLEKLQNGDITKKEIVFYNNKAEECVFTFSKVEGNDWYVLSMVPTNSFHNMYDFFQQFGLFAICIGSLFILDMLILLIFTHFYRKKSLETEKANMAKSNFLSSMSHDIRTPLNAIIGMTIVIDKYLEQKQVDIDTIKEYVKTIEISGNQLILLVNDILDISKIESGTFELQPNEFSIANLLNNIISTQQTQIKTKDLIFESHVINVKHEFVFADELKLSQIFINILNNAIKYTENGGKIIVTLSEESSEKEGCSRYIYKVEDTGIGIDKQFLDKIFQRFIRSDDLRAIKKQGSGIGLTIVKEIVDAMEGTINVESKINEGSTFTVTLDIKLAKKQPVNVKFNNLSALVIDDDNLILENTKRDLMEMGVITDCAKTGSEALTMVKAKHKSKNNYDFIFVDWYMDEMSGREVIKQLQSKYGKKHKIIVISAYNTIEIEKQAKRLGINTIINKPLFKSKLKDSIAQTLNPKTTKKEKVDYANLNVLVAEDNDINWLTVSKILSFFKIKADRADTGKTAVDMVQGKKQYDLILMDLQMPTMDGYEATKLIRALPDKDISNIQIYAMTADIFANDIKSCLDNGMNGHLAKPIEINKLVKVLDTVHNKKNKK